MLDLCRCGSKMLLWNVFRKLDSHFISGYQHAMHMLFRTLRCRFIFLMPNEIMLSGSANRFRSLHPQRKLNCSKGISYKDKQATTVSSIGVLNAQLCWRVSNTRRAMDKPVRIMLLSFLCFLAICAISEGIIGHSQRNTKSRYVQKPPRRRFEVGIVKKSSIWKSRSI